MRFGVVHGCLGLLAGVGCGLLSPFPGGGNPSSLLADGPDGEPGGSPAIECFAGTTCMPADEPLIDPSTDDTINATSNEETIIAFPGKAFTIDLNFIALNSNVVGGGIRFPGSDEIQWTFIDGLEGLPEGDIRFGYVVASEICGEVPPLCHEILTEQFAVARNVTGDVDGDGRDDGDFVVSAAVEVPVILKCASCDSPSCSQIEALDGECQSCDQPEQCAEVFDLCFAEGQPKFGTDEADNFEMFFGRDGLSWKSNTICRSRDGEPTPGEVLCQNVLDDLAVECMMLDTDTDGMMTMEGTG